MTVRTAFDIVIPTVGRPSLHRLLVSLDRCQGPRPRRIIVVDDRGGAPRELLERDPPASVTDRMTIVRSGGRGPAAARNVGWRRSTARWIAFLDDDVVVPGDWLAALHADLADLLPDVGASQGQVRVPLPTHRRPTDWERNVAGLEDARWATADMAYRRDVLAAVGGFDERFPRAYREDAELGLRVTDLGWRIVSGSRHVLHPVPPADAAVSIRKQAGNADDPLMWALHGRTWRDRAGVPRGRRPWHLATVAAAGTATGAALAARPRVAVAGLATWAGLTADFAWRRIRPGPRTAAEISTMVATSVAIPFAATAHSLRGVATLPHRLRRSGPVPSAPAAILFDRDGTLIHDVPYNTDPELVRPVEGAAETLDRVRRLGIAIGVVTNQSAIGRGLATPQQVQAVNRRVEELLGPIDAWAICPHAPDAGCACRKPRAGLVECAAADLGVDPSDCVLIGDIGADVGAADAAGARGILVPASQTRTEEVDAAREVAPDLATAVDLALGIRPVPAPTGTADTEVAA